MSVNKWIGIGNLGRDPDLRAMPSGEAVANISVACTEAWTDKETGKKNEHVEWVRVVMFGKTAEIAGEYLTKGSLVYIEGKLQTRKWTDKDGQERYTTEVRCERMQMLGGKPASKPKEAKGGGDDQGKPEDMEDDIPW